MPVSEWRHTLTVVAVVTLLAGCTTDTGAGGDSGGHDPTIRASAGDGSDHPLALFQGENLGLIDYAQLKLQNQCLAKAGYPQNLNTMLSGPRAAFPGLVITPRTFGPTTEQEARRIGFGWDQPSEPPAVVSYDPNYDRALDDCAKQAWKRLGQDGQRIYFAYYDLGNNLSKSLMKTITERLDPQLPTKMLTCIRGKGYQPTDEQVFLKTPRPQLLGVRFGQPDPGAGASWAPRKVPGTVQVGPAVAARQYHATPEEGALAVAWLQCRQETTMAAQEMTAAVAEIGRAHV